MCMLVAIDQHVDLVDSYLLSIETTDNSYGLDQHWLLIHERALYNPNIESHFRGYCGEKVLTFLRSQGVRFIDSTKIVATDAKAAWPLRVPQWLE